MSGGRRIPADNLREYFKYTLKKRGLNKKEADILSDAMVESSLRGLDGHGIESFSIYINAIKRGIIKPCSKVEIEKETKTTVLINANGGIGHVAGKKAMKICIKKGRDYGIGIAGVKNSNHFGFAAYYAMMPLKEGMVGVALSNSPPRVAPWGAKAAYLGTNPFSIAIPTGSDIPFVADMATSVAALQKINLAKNKGEKIPDNWAIDSSGKPTSEPEKALKGALMPMGGVKGYAVSFLIDVFCGILTGATFGNHYKSRLLGSDPGYPQNIGHFFAAVKINNFIPLEQFKKRLQQEITEIKNLPVREGFPGIYIPGEIEENMRKKNTKEGIFVSSETLKKFEEISNELDLSFDL